MDKLNKLLEEYPNGKGDLDSLKFLRGFIKWLVDNDKIDLGKLIMIKDEEQKAIVDIDNSRENTLLMLLAIQDEPIEFLISVLK